MAVDAEAEQDEVEARQLSAPGAERLGEHADIFPSRLLWIGLATHAEHLVGRHGYLGQQRLSRHPVVRLRMVGRDAPLVTKENPGTLPGDLFTRGRFGELRIG